MPRAKRPAPCHPDRDHYAKEMCKSCYITSVRKKSSRQKVDADYEERNREARNAVRLARYHKRKTAESSESNHGADGTFLPKPLSSE